MHVFSIVEEARWDPKKHVEKILGKIEEGDVTVACWEPHQISPYHCHPFATEIYFCFEGGGIMRTPTETITVKPGAFVVHPPGEVHEYANGAPPHAAVPRPLRHRHGRPPSRLARPRRAGRKARRMPPITRRIRSGPSPLVIAREAKQSRRRRRGWIASSRLHRSVALRGRRSLLTDESLLIRAAARG